MTINAIMAMDLNGGIGKNNALPWPHNHHDMKWFRENTIGGVVVMGRKTWESIGSKPLKYRKNIVITNGQVEGSPDDIYFGDMGKVLQTIQSDNPGKTIWVMGGAEIYRQALPYCDNLYLSKFKETFNCDTFIDPELLKPFSKLITCVIPHNDLTFTAWSKH